MSIHFTLHVTATLQDILLHYRFEIIVGEWWYVVRSIQKSFEVVRMVFGNLLMKLIRIDRIIIIVCFIRIKVYGFVVRGQIIIDMLVSVIIRIVVRFRSEIDMVYVLWISAIIKVWSCLSRIVGMSHISRRCVTCCCVRGS